MVDWNPRANEIFLHAAEIDDPDARRAYIDAECGDDADLRRQVDSLLAAHEEMGSFLQRYAVSSPGEASETPPYQPITEGPGTIIGPYKLLQKIGEGGFGAVYMAEQEKPIRRMVAVKIIKPGMDSGEVLARFESERQALAMMDHPNIAKVLDAGASESGRPYFVMELVKGVPITEFCDRNKIPAEQRLKLFVDVSNAIQHAHHKGVIHRDIKPSNVLVTLHDGVPVVKVIDFGVAKATLQKLTERTLFTAYGQMIGTPAYMSPEQAEMSGLDIDTRSDIYSLGVLLYELLTGTTPLELKRLREAGYSEIQRLIREEEPPRPSARLSSLGQAATVIAGNRGMDAKYLAQLLSGDLDWIVMRCLEKDRNRRYATPSALAEDIDRFFRSESVTARSLSAGYRLWKFAKRNRGILLTAASVAAALLLGTIVATWQAVRAHRAEKAALDSAAAESAAKETAQAREAETAAVLDFVEKRVFAAARPKDQAGGLGYDVKLADAIRSALPSVESDFSKQPLVEARLRRTLGESFSYLGNAQMAVEQLQRARLLFSEHLGPDHHDTLSSMDGLAHSYGYAGRDPEALRLREEALALGKARLGPDHPATVARMDSLAHSYTAVGRHSEALRLREEALALQKTKLGPDHPDTLWSMNNLAWSLVTVPDEKLRDPARGLELAKKAVRTTDERGRAAALGTLGTARYRCGNWKGAITDLGKVIESRGPEDPINANEAFFLAMAHWQLGEKDRAREWYGKAVALMEKLNKEDPEPKRFRAEAEALMGTEKKP
jgi:serine/threonine protein kinase/tetratricopeptide (TPR) repeat protein